MDELLRAAAQAAGAGDTTTAAGRAAEALLVAGWRCYGPGLLALADASMLAGERGLSAEARVLWHAARPFPEPDPDAFPSDTTTRRRRR